MASIDSRFYLAFTFDKYFVDKDTGAPLANGYIKFYQDSQRTVPKDVYILSGTPGNYTYTNIGSTVTLNAVGVPQYDNNNVALYFFPYDGDIETTTGTVELYYYAVFSEGDVEQFTREAQPNVFPSESTARATGNYIPNGQFLIHNDIPATDDNNNNPGEISSAITIIAPGGWTFERPSDSTATDILTFERINSLTSTNPPDNPRYTITIENENPGSGDAIKDLRVKLGSVNKFASSTDTYTYVLYAVNKGSGTVPVKVILIKNYGTGGSPQTETVLSTINVAMTGTLYPISFQFGTNNGKILGDNNDDFLQLALRMPGDEVFEVTFGDFGLFYSNGNGNITNLIFAATTNRQMMYQTLFQDFNWPNPTNYTPNTPLNGFPAYDGSTYYLPLVYTPNGIAFDDSEIGDIIAESTPLTNYTNSISTKTNRLLADGNKYPTEGYSPLGIPYSRLQSKYWVEESNIPLYGTGGDYSFATYSEVTSLLYLYNNEGGAVTDIADGSSATGFTFATICPGVANTYAKGKYVGNNAFLLINDQRGLVDNVTANTSGFAVVTIRTGKEYLLSPTSDRLTQLTLITTIGGSSITGGDYFRFFSTNEGVQHDRYVWYRVDGVGADPAPGGTGIRVDILSTNTADDVALLTSQAIGGQQISTIATVAASSLSGGEYFTFSSTGDNFYVWYTIAGVGSDPKVTGAIGIKVELTGSETAEEVAGATAIAINKKYFAVPNLQGTFLRGYVASTGNIYTQIDPEIERRWSYSPIIVQDNVGTVEFEDIFQHLHPIQYGDGVGEPTLDFLKTESVINGNTVQGIITTNYSPQAAGYESRPANTFVNYAVKY